MYLVRPANFIDVPAIEKLMADNSVRVTTLPSDRNKLSDLINQSTQSFAADLDDINPKSFLFVLENLSTHEIEGVSGLDSNAGGGYPFFNYRLEDLIHASHNLNVNQRIPVLYLSHELTESTVLKSFAIKSELKGTPAFELLSRARLIFIASFRYWFSSRVVTELQGVLDENGQSPFWDSLGRHFFDIDFETADYYVGIKNKTFIAELMPQHPIYVPLMTDAAKAAINQAHPATKYTTDVLFREGFQKSRYIDIFDGGPVLKNKTDEIETIRHYKKTSYEITESVAEMNYLICNPRPEKFRCILGRVNNDDQTKVSLLKQDINTLELEPNDELGFAPLELR